MGVTVTQHLKGYRPFSWPSALLCHRASPTSAPHVNRIDSQASLRERTVETRIAMETIDRTMIFGITFNHCETKVC